ncbi:hypothetical protein [Virgibacillus sp. JSM 102003]|uniref:hypothetical protein n=1 Tax=Virgibacillus sp. JSM 102003 TaxID=1562108 RepID=UPI0035C0B4EC
MQMALFALLIGFSFIIFGFFGPISIGIIIFGFILGGIGVVLGSFSITNSNVDYLLNDPKRIDEAFKKWISEKLSEYNIVRDDMKYLHTANKYYILKPDIGNLYL